MLTRLIGAIVGTSVLVRLPTLVFALNSLFVGVVVAAIPCRFGYVWERAVLNALNTAVGSKFTEL